MSERAFFRTLVGPDALRGRYPERPDREDSWADLLAERLADALLPSRRLEAARSRRRLLARVQGASDGLESAGEAELERAVWRLRQEVAARGLDGQRAARGFALVREWSVRALGQRPREVQLLGGWAMLCGALAEMRTGEGKTLTATLPACTAALAGVPVHVVTANDYLAARDAEEMGPLYRALGLRVAAITSAESDPERRRQAWSADVVYCTGQQLAFDYLRDRRALRNRRVGRRTAVERLGRGESGTDALLLRGLCFAIVDEADHVLIDEAGTPLVLAQKRPAGEGAQSLAEIVALASQMKETLDFRSERSPRGVELLPAGRERLDAWALEREGEWASERWREQQLKQALYALHLLQRDRDYLVRDGGVHIIDPSTGRVLPDRSWQGGLHQLVEVKEGLEASGRTESLARITYQRLFRRYWHLAGMSGTAYEVRSELRGVYGLRVVRIPTHRPSRLMRGPRRVYCGGEPRWSAALERVRERTSAGQPVLLGTASVASSERLSALLRAAGIDHQLLNARQDANEAELVARAGRAGCITVATGMAGRGTDIRLGPGVLETGGLHVIACECSEARRIERQLYGRAGRQGDPGSWEALSALEDDVLLPFCGWLSPGLWKRIASADGSIAGPLGALLVWAARRSQERGRARARKELWKMDRRLDDLLAFAGTRE